ncbi:hypothetical protein IF2G_02069 [Cordyceps javanica]|nr:hypothetical protein IF2G_02069 [Cordyceps javanica]
MHDKDYNGRKVHLSYGTMGSNNTWVQTAALAEPKGICVKVRSWRFPDDVPCLSSPQVGLVRRTILSEVAQRQVADDEEDHEGHEDHEAAHPVSSDGGQTHPAPDYLCKRDQRWVRPPMGSPCWRVTVRSAFANGTESPKDRPAHAHRRLDGVGSPEPRRGDDGGSGGGAFPVSGT